MTQDFDSDGQPINTWLNAARNATRDTNELIGLCKGVLLDGKVCKAEAEFLLDWLKKNNLTLDRWPGNIIAERIATHLQDGILDNEEAEDLKQLLLQVTGADFQPLTAGNSSTRCFDNPQPPITFEGQKFCLSGKFALGPRKACEQEIKDLGGKTGNLVLETNYLVIGSIGSRDWAHSSYGRKIEKAKEWQQQGINIAVISEDHWAEHL